LEFDEFMKIGGCKEGSHLFVGAKRDENKEELVNCRLDHYQTPMQVHVSAFAKGMDKAKSKVVLEAQQVSRLSLAGENDLSCRSNLIYSYLPTNESQRPLHSTAQSTQRPALSVSCPPRCVEQMPCYDILTDQVEMVLQKPAPASWPVLELPPPGSELPPGYALTFGVSGRTGTIGGKEIVLAAEEVGRR
jgi:hypothetical protein